MKKKKVNMLDLPPYSAPSSNVNVQQLLLRSAVQSFIYDQSVYESMVK